MEKTCVIDFTVPDGYIIPDANSEYKTQSTKIYTKIYNSFPLLTRSTLVRTLWARERTGHHTEPYKHPVLWVSLLHGVHCSPHFHLAPAFQSLHLPTTKRNRRWWARGSGRHGFHRQRLLHADLTESEPENTPVKCKLSNIRNVSPVKILKLLRYKP